MENKTVPGHTTYRIRMKGKYPVYVERQDSEGPTLALIPGEYPNTFRAKITAGGVSRPSIMTMGEIARDYVLSKILDGKDPSGILAEHGLNPGDSIARYRDSTRTFGISIIH